MGSLYLYFSSIAHILLPFLGLQDTFEHVLPCFGISALRLFVVCCRFSLLSNSPSFIKVHDVARRNISF